MAILPFLLGFLLSLPSCFSSNDTNNNPPPSTAPFPPLKNPISFPLRRVSRLLDLDHGANYTSTSDKDYKRTSLTRFQLLYLVEVKLGSGRVPAHLLLDTGSSLSWWQCFPCHGCYTQDDPKFLPSESTSYINISCTGPLKIDCLDTESFIMGCIEKNCGYAIRYGDGDLSRGRIGQDDLYSVDGTFIKRILFGCAEFNQGSQFWGEYAGIMGLGFGYYSFPNQIEASFFSFCLVTSPNKEAFLHLHDSPLPTDNGSGTITVSMYANNRRLSAHYVLLSGIEIGKTKVEIKKEKWEIDSNGNYGVAVDTGTPLTIFPKDDYAIFRDAFRAEFEEFEDFMDKDLDKTPTLDTCYDFYGDEKDDYFESVPEVKFYFFDVKMQQSRALTFGWKQVMIEIIRSDTHVRSCLAFQSESYSFTLIGAHQLQGTTLSYNTEEMTLQFDPDQC